MDSGVHAAQNQFLAFFIIMYVCATSDCKEERGRLLVGPRENREVAFCELAVLRHRFDTQKWLEPYATAIVYTVRCHFLNGACCLSLLTARYHDDATSIPSKTYGGHVRP